jgi:hypothetical protein
MTQHDDLKSIELHHACAVSLDEWGWALWWTGILCLVLSAGLFVAGMPVRCLAMASLYWPIALVRNVCFRRCECHADCMRQELKDLTRTYLRGRP